MKRPIEVLIDDETWLNGPTYRGYLIYPVWSQGWYAVLLSTDQKPYAREGFVTLVEAVEFIDELIEEKKNA